MPTAFYLSDGLMLIFAVTALVGARRQDRRRIVPRWQLLWPGGAAFLSCISLMLFPNPWHDLFSPEIQLVALLGTIAGVARGQFMPLGTDHNFAEVRIERGRDATWAAALLTVVAVGHTTIEMLILAVARIMPTTILLMTLLGGYLLGRSVAAFRRAYFDPHEDLRKD